MFFIGIFNGGLKKRRVMLCMHTRRMFSNGKKITRPILRSKELFLMPCQVGCSKSRKIK